MVRKDEPTIKRESTSIKIRPDVWKEAKIAAIRNDMDLSELVEDAIQKYIADQVAKASKGEKKS